MQYMLQGGEWAKPLTFQYIRGSALLFKQQGNLHSMLTVTDFVYTVNQGTNHCINYIRPSCSWQALQIFMMV